MAARIPDETLQAIRDRASIVDIVSSHVSLKRAGRNHLGLCPFHAEKTPSFTVNEERGFFHCFGCGAGGNVFGFLMRIENVEFIDAVRMLAQRVGVELRLGEDSGRRSDRERLIALNEHMQRRFRRSLDSSAGAAARSYLEKRGLSAAAIERYSLGFCPRAGTGFIEAIAGKPEAQRAATTLGLISSRDDGRCYERMWGRVTFPIRDVTGAIVGFGGRAIFDQQPKYLNSPESPIFHKGSVLYGLYEAKAAVRERQRIVLVEGYMDAIALVEQGIAEAVATLGTALTSTQLRLAKRFAPAIIAFFDGDRAGQKAAMRAFETSIEADVQALGAFLPEGLDPDDYIRRNGVAATEQLLEKAIPLAEYFVQQSSPPPGAPFQTRVAAAERIAAVLARVNDPVELGIIARRAAQQLEVDESIFRRVRRAPTRPGQGVAAASETVQNFAPAAPRPEEMLLLQAAAADQTAAETIARREISKQLENIAVAEAVEGVLAARRQGDAPAVAIDRLSPAAASHLSAALLSGEPCSPAEWLQVVEDCCQRIVARAAVARAKEMKNRLQQAEIAGDRDYLIEVAEPYLELKRSILKPSSEASLEPRKE
ncbi:MAG TPA: DNA primase [Terriglobales bacterium]|nr:DNA primase [Terriglobales bacterium]